jgi:anti-sigma factor RsiW
MSDSDKAAAERHEQVEGLLGDYAEGGLDEDGQRRVKEHLAECDACRADLAELEEAIRALSGLHKMSAPQDFDNKVAKTIERRSAGRFFGRKAFGDRIPFELLAVVALVLALAVFALLRTSATGTLDRKRGTPAPEIHEDAREVVPKP